MNAAALLSPFDPCFDTGRAWCACSISITASRFGCPAKNKSGDIAFLPFLLGDLLVACVDLKSDRQSGRLRVLAAFIEWGVQPAVVADALGREHQTMAVWMGLGSVAVEPLRGLPQAVGVGG